MLLDPINPHDPTLLTFDLNGTAIVAPHVTDLWERKRATYSIARLNLNFGQLAGKRKVVWKECWNRAQDYLDELGKYHNDKTKLIAKTECERHASSILSLMERDKELSTIARACIENSGDERLKRLLSYVR